MMTDNTPLHHRGIDGNPIERREAKLVPSAWNHLTLEVFSSPEMIISAPLVLTGRIGDNRGSRRQEGTPAKNNRRRQENEPTKWCWDATRRFLRN
jgi:hypothetical protein